MTNEERDIIERFIARFGGNAPQQPGQPPLPPIDPDADAHIKTQLGRYPEALYRLVQSAFVQEAALGQMKQRVERLQWELEQSQQAQPAQQPARSGFLGGLFGGGAGAAQQPAYQPPPYNPPPPQYAPGVAQPGMVQGGSSGFLGSALTTAAGVAGGLVVGNALMDLFSGPHGGMGGGFGGMGMGGGFGGGFGGQAPAEETVINNYNGAPSDPWGAGQGAPDQGNGYWSKDDVYQNSGAAQPDQGWTDSGNGGDAGSDAGSDAGASDWSDSGSGGNDDWS